MTLTDALLRRGDRGEAVRDVQERLVAAGYAVDPDGAFGEHTEASVRTFQRARGLRVDGICGPETWGALVESSYRLGDRLVYLRRPMLRGDDVAELQRLLNALGFDAGREDGILGLATERALRRFQRDAGLAPDGVCGPATIAAIARVAGLAAGSVASVREREALRRDPRPLSERRLFVVAHPGLEILASLVARGARDSGAEVALDASGDDPGVIATEANRFEADVCLGLGPGVEPGVRCAYYATQRFRSEAGFWIAGRLTEALRGVVAEIEPPVGRTYRLLRETRMAAVAVELFAPDDEGVALDTARVPALAGAIVDGVRRGVEEPIDLP